MDDLHAEINKGFKATVSLLYTLNDYASSPMLVGIIQCIEIAHRDFKKVPSMPGLLVHRNIGKLQSDVTSLKWKRTQPKSLKAIFKFESILLTVSAFWSCMDTLNMLLTDKGNSKIILASSVVKRSPLLENRFFAQFEGCLGNVVGTQKLCTFLDFEDKLQRFRERKVLPHLKQKYVVGLVQHWLNSAGSACFSAPCSFPLNFNPDTIFRLLDTFTVLSSHSSQWGCQLDDHPLEYQCYFAIKQFVFGCQIHLYYEDVFDSAQGENVHEKELLVEEFSLFFWEKKDVLTTETRANEPQTLLAFDFTAAGKNKKLVQRENILKVSSHLLPGAETKLFLQFIFIVSMPSPFELSRFCDPADSLLPRTLWELWNLQICDPTLQQVDNSHNQSQCY